MIQLPDRLTDLPTPCLVLDLDVLERNIRTMARRMKRLGVKLRPHFKTHKCPTVGDLQRQHGAEGFTVSTLSEAEHLVEHGCDDLTWAFPLILSRVGQLRPLLERTTLRLVVDSPEAIGALESELSDVDSLIHVWLKVDCGYHRAGVDPVGPLAVELACQIQDVPALSFDGILSHSGHAYGQRTREGLRAIAEEERVVMVEFADRLRAEGIECPGLSVGSTPAMSAVENLKGITEARPGNYVFYDYTQVQLGACAITDVALTVLSSVVSSQPGARHSVIDAGALSLSKDPGPSWQETATFGEIYEDYATGELSADVRVVSLSQEHGILSAALGVGERVRIVPNHSCLVVPHFEHYVLVRGEAVVGNAPIWRC